MRPVTASITIALDDEFLDLLRTMGSLTVALGSPGMERRRVAPRGLGRGEWRYRIGSFPDRLLTWAKALKRPFGCKEMMRKFAMTRHHSQTLLTRVMRAGHVKRVRRGRYALA